MAVRQASPKRALPLGSVDVYWTFSAHPYKLALRLWGYAGFTGEQVYSTSNTARSVPPDMSKPSIEKIDGAQYGTAINGHCGVCGRSVTTQYMYLHRPICKPCRWNRHSLRGALSLVGPGVDYGHLSLTI